MDTIRLAEFNNKKLNFTGFITIQLPVRILLKEIIY